MLPRSVRGDWQEAGTADPIAAQYVPADAAQPGELPTGPHGIALYDNDDPEHPDELSFITNAVLVLTKVLDDEWLEGYIYGVEPKKVGIFPAAFVEVIIIHLGKPPGGCVRACVRACVCVLPLCAYYRSLSPVSIAAGRLLSFSRCPSLLSRAHGADIPHFPPR